MLRIELDTVAVRLATTDLLGGVKDLAGVVPHVFDGVKDRAEDGGLVSLDIDYLREFSWVEGTERALAERNLFSERIDQRRAIVASLGAELAGAITVAGGQAHAFADP